MKIILVSCRAHASDYTHQISVGSCRRSPISWVNADMPDIRYHYRSDTNHHGRHGW